MRRTILVFAVMVSLLMLACAATAEEKKKDEEKSTLAGVKDTIMMGLKYVLDSGLLKTVKLSSLFGLFDRTLQFMKTHEENIEEVHEKCIKEHGKIEFIRIWARSASEKAMQSRDLTQKLQLIAANEETGKKQIKQVEKQQKIIEETKTEADAAIKEFDEKQSLLVQMVIKTVSDEKFPSSGSLVGLGIGGFTIVKDMYSSFQKVNKASTTTYEALQEAYRALNNIKRFLNETQQTQRSLQTSELKHAAQRIIMGPNGTIISDVSSVFSLIQNVVLLTLVAAFLIADKPVW